MRFLKGNEKTCQVQPISHSSAKKMLTSDHVTALRPFPEFHTKTSSFASALGLAVCPSLNLLVTSSFVKDTLSVWKLPDEMVGKLSFVCFLGGAVLLGSPGRMRFDFRYRSGYLVFTPASKTTCPLLLVSDNGHATVHMIDVVKRSHVGYIAPPGSIAQPRGVAACSTLPLVAVSAWKSAHCSDNVVILYQYSARGTWEKMRVIEAGFVTNPCGLRFSRDGSSICVADCCNHRASVFHVADGGFVGHIASGLTNACDVEEVEGGWLVACFGSHTVEFVSDGPAGGGGGRFHLGKVDVHGSGDNDFLHPVVLATVPGFGLAVFDHDGCVRMFSPPDVIAMWRNMSRYRIEWMAAVVKAAACGSSRHDKLTAWHG
jgi:hypothetical protein